MADLQAMRLHLREAERLGHNYIGCEHLLLGVLADAESDAAKVLMAHGVTLDAARRQIAEICGDHGRDAVRWTYSTRATVVRHLAEVEAERLDHHEATDVHLTLVVITEGAGVPNRLFAHAAVDTQRLIEDLVDLLEVSEETRAVYLHQRHTTQRARRQLVQDVRRHGGEPDSP